MNRALLAIGGLLVGLLALLFAAPAMVDWNRYRGVFEEEASRFLGREVRVGGHVNLRLLPVPFVRFEKVRVADTTASVGKPLFMADDLTVWLSVGSLLKGAFEASEIELHHPEVTLVLDGRGGGSWSSLAAGAGPGNFSPTEVAFNAVRITDGSLAVLASDGKPKTTFSHINGELSAQAIDGPYKIAAAFAQSDHPREIRLSTAKPDADGAVRFKGTVRDPGNGISYSLDGSARDVLRHLAVTGELTARLPLPAAMLSGARSDKGGSGDFELRAQLEGDTSGFTLSDLALSFEQGGRPQLASGSAKVVWLDQTDVTLSLGSHWLDLDRIAGTDTGRPPLLLAETVLTSIAAALATEGRTEANLKIEQAILGGDVVSDLEAVLEHAKGRLAVRSLAAHLPGGARLATTGTFEPKSQGSRYEGRVSLRGASLTRFLGWAARDIAVPSPTNDAPFALTGDLSLGRAAIAAHNVSLAIGRNILTGEGTWSSDPQQAVTLKLEGSELDLSSLIDKQAKPPQALRALIAQLTGNAAGQPARKPGNADVKLRVDRLVARALLLRNVDAEFRITDGYLAMPLLRFSSDEGYGLDLHGEIANLNGADAKGALIGLVMAEKADGVAALAQLAGLPDDMLPSPDTGATLAPLRLAGRLDIGTKGADTRQLVLDGLLAGSRLAGSVKLGADDGGWQTRSADIALSLEGADLSRLTQRLTAANATARATTAPAAVASRLRLRAIGTAKAGLDSLARLYAPGGRSEFQGRMALDKSGHLDVGGEIELAADDLVRVLNFAGVTFRQRLAGKVAGKVRVEHHTGALKFTSDRFAIAGTMAQGAIAIEPTSAGHRLTGEVKLETASLATALAVLSSGAQSAASMQNGASMASQWSEAALDLSSLEALAGSQIQLDIGKLTLADGLNVSKARVELAARPGGLDMRLVEAKALGGSASGSIALDRAPAGVHMTLDARLAAVRLEALSARRGSDDKRPVATGGLSLAVKAQSTALSPRGLVLALAGAGDLATDRARLERWTPSAIGIASEAILGLKGEIPPGALAGQLEAALNSGGVAVGSQRLSVTIENGTLGVAPLNVETPRGQLSGKAFVDLDHLKVDGEWRIAPRNTPQPAGLPPKPELPGIAIVYTGLLTRLASLEPRFDIDALEREVAVRKIEREVAELERLRRLDEERARLEAERIAKEKLDAERRLAEKFRLESLPQALGTAADGGAPPAIAVTPVPAGAPIPAPADSGAATPTGAQAANPGTAAAPAPSPAAQPPVTVERSPLPRPASDSAPTPAKSKRVDPFRRLMESSP